MAKRIATAMVIGLAWMGAASPARAQRAGDQLKILLSHESGGSGGPFSDNATQTVYRLLLGETTTFPIASAAGGFTWTFDAALNVPRRRSQSFGPMFAERPFTTGAGKLNVGMAFQHTDFRSVGGVPLTNLTQSVTYNNGTAFSDFYGTSSSLAIAIDRTIASATYGVTERVDVGVIVPIGRASVSGTSVSGTVAELARSSDSQVISGSSSGLGDVIVRAKVALFSTPHVDTAFNLDLRLPTGDPDKLLGTGQTQAKAMFIASSTVRALNPHINVGYTFGGSGLTFGSDTRWQGSFGDPQLLSSGVSEEFNYVGGVDIAATHSITIAGDVIGRALRNSAVITLYDDGPQADTRVVFLHLAPGTVNLLLGAAGVKVRVGGTWLVTATLLFPLNDNGIKPGVTPVVGFERAF